MARKSLASLDQFVEGFKAHPFVVGIDVHKRSLSVALLRADGKVVSCKGSTQDVPLRFPATKRLGRGGKLGVCAKEMQNSLGVDGQDPTSGPPLNLLMQPLTKPHV